TGTICSTTVMALKKKITLGERESFRRIALKQLPVGTHLIRFRVDLDVGCCVVQLHVALAEFSASSNRRDGAAQAREIAACPAGQLSQTQTSSSSVPRRQSCLSAPRTGRPVRSPMRPIARAPHAIILTEPQPSRTSTPSMVSKRDRESRQPPPSAPPRKRS